MSKRVSPTERIRAQIDELFASERDLASILEDVARLGVRLVMQAALEAEVTEALGRAPYERRGEDSPAGSRNGWQPPATVKTTMGPVELSRPKLRGTDEVFCSRLFGVGVTRTNALESLVISGWVRGLSDRDIEAALAEVLGPEAALSKSTVSRICQAIHDEFKAWKTRCLAQVRLGLLVLGRLPLQDAPLRPSRAGAGRLGHRHRRPPRVRGPGAGSGRVHRRLGRLLGRPGGSGTASSAAGRLRRRPGAVGRHRAALRRQPAPALCHPSPPQRCGQGVQGGPGRVQGRLVGVFDGIKADPGAAALSEASRRAAEFATKWAKAYPAAVACLTDDLASLTVHLRFPAEHWRRIRHSNFIERTFGETRRRVKVIGRLPGENTCLSFVWAVLGRASRGWRGVTHTPRSLRLLQDLRRQLLHPPAVEGVIDEAVTAAA